VQRQIEILNFYRPIRQKMYLISYFIYTTIKLQNKLNSSKLQKSQFLLFFTYLYRKLPNRLIEVLENDKYKLRARCLQFSSISSYSRDFSTNILINFYNVSLKFYLALDKCIRRYLCTLYIVDIIHCNTQYII